MDTENSSDSSRAPQSRSLPLHLVIGWDQAAREAIRVLQDLGSEIVIVAAKRPEDIPSGVSAIEGRTDDPEVLRRAGIGEAASVLVALPAPEARRALVAAKALNPSVRIVASVQEAGSGPDLRDAGAHAAVDPREEAGREMVRLMLVQPSEVDRGNAR